MTDLVRRALLGDREAQEECTRQGIVLLCPFCGGQAQMESSPTLTAIRPSIEGLSGGGLAETERYRYNIHCKNCGNACKKMGYGGRATKSFKTKSAAISAWNTRQGPPIGRCGDCAYSQNVKSNGKGFNICPASGMEITNEDFCSYFEPKAQKKEANHETD